MVEFLIQTLLDDSTTQYSAFLRTTIQTRLELSNLSKCRLGNIFWKFIFCWLNISVQSSLFMSKDQVSDIILEAKWRVWVTETYVSGFICSSKHFFLYEVIILAWNLSYFCKFRSTYKLLHLNISGVIRWLIILLGECYFQVSTVHRFIKLNDFLSNEASTCRGPWIFWFFHKQWPHIITSILIQSIYLTTS